MSQTPRAGAPASRRRRRSAAVLTVSAAVAVAGLGAVAPAATSAPSATCPAAFPLEDLTKGQTVRGLTVTEGTVPENFTGRIVGTIDDGIAPGLDMILADLEGYDAVDKAGIWFGMSGSPVYAADGRLIGSVSYGLSWSASTIAGITPAAEMHKLLSDENDPSVPATLAKAATADEVAIPRSLQRQMVSSGTAEAAEADAGMSRLRLPLGVSGVSQERIKLVRKSLDLEGAAVYKAGSSTTTLDPSPPIVPGGNLAASLSYGDVSFVGTGTATAVCGDEVLAFGHPMMWTGPSQLSMHNADAKLIQPDPTFGSFKVANALAPLGGVAQDRRAALLGLESASALPETSLIAADVSVPSDPYSEPRHGETFVSVREALPDIAATHLLADQDRVFDRIAGGSATIGWSFDIERADGSITTFTREDKWANTWDISYEPTWDLFAQLWQIQNNDAEKVTIQEVRADSVLHGTYKAYSIAKVHYLKDGRWVPVPQDRPLRIRAGSMKAFNLTLTSSNLPKRYFRVDVPIPDNTGRKSGVINILGGNSYYGGFGDFYGEGGGTATADLDKLLARLEGAPRNDHVLANLRLFSRHGTIRRHVRELAPAVVDGGMSIPVQGVLPKG